MKIQVTNNIECRLHHAMKTRARDTCVIVRAIHFKPSSGKCQDKNKIKRERHLHAYMCGAIGRRIICKFLCVVNKIEEEKNANPVVWRAVKNCRKKGNLGWFTVSDGRRAFISRIDLLQCAHIRHYAGTCLLYMYLYVYNKFNQPYNNHPTNIKNTNDFQ